jgi:hypothetical protein
MPVMYVPVLRGKEGEYGALEELSTGVKDSILPLVEIPSVPFDYANERPARTLDEHIAGIAERLNRCWGGRHLYLDMPWFGDNERLASGAVAVQQVLHDCIVANVLAIPVVTTSSSAPYLEAVRRQLPRCDGQICIRFSEADFDEEGDTDPSEQLARLMDAVGADDLSKADLLLDLGDIGSDIGRATLVARSVLAQAPRLRDWRRLILAAASFPENLSEVGAATTSRLSRVEWQLWTRLKRRGHLQREDLIFGDYAVSHPAPTELDPRTMRMSASIRYTTPNDWLVLKGRNVRQYGFDQYFELARELVGLPEFSGEGFSWGDRFIQRCARGDAGPGNATTWRKVGTNHHLTLLARELAANALPAA